VIGMKSKGKPPCGHQGTSGWSRPERYGAGLVRTATDWLCRAAAMVERQIPLS
jgi:hypothetical protein